MADLEDWEEWDSSKLSFVHHMIAGSFAGLAEHVTVFPIDTLKTHVQCERCGSTKPNQVWNCATRIVRNEGIFRLWRGVSAMFAGCIPAHAAYFSVYEGMKSVLLKGQSGEHHPIKAALCGASGSITHDLCMTPFDVVKQRMQLGYYNSLSHCVSTIIRTEGITALYRSLPLTVSMNIPYAAILVAVNESMRVVLQPFAQVIGDSNSSATAAVHSISMQTAMISGAVGGGVAAACTTPLDVVKTRLQTQNLKPCPKLTNTSAIMASMAGGANSNNIGSVRGVTTSIAIGEGSVVVDNLPLSNSSSSTSSGNGSSLIKYRNAYQTIRNIISEEGYVGLTRGMLPRILTNAPAAGISWAVYEGIKNLLTDRNSSNSNSGNSRL